MLRELRITNLALIEKLSLSFHDGLTVLTGETGAGKSIVLQAIHLLAGRRASADWVRSGAEEAMVEALFEFSSGQLDLLRRLREAGVEAEGELIVKRVISVKGKSRFFLNGSLATAVMVGEMVEELLSVAGQHEHQHLLKPRYHLECLDALGDLGADRRQFAALYEQWLAAKARLASLAAGEQEKEQRRDFLTFQCREIEEAAIQPDEEEELARERDFLKSSDTLQRLGRVSYAALSEEVTPALAVIRKNLEQMAGLDPRLTPLAEEIAAAFFQLEEALPSLARYLEAVPDDPACLDRIMARIDQLQRLKRKYGGTLAEVLAFGEEAARELAALDTLGEQLAALAAQVTEQEEELRRRAGLLSAARRAVACELEEKAAAELASLALEQARFAVSFGDTPGELTHLSRLGWDRPEFVFSANPGEELKPVAKVASGGELSRLTLALKGMLARHDQVETVIFDEIDSGISGRTADSVGRKIRELAGHHQVFCITHLPQIAAGADEHLVVRKTVRGERTQTEVAPLAPAERAGELARMLSGDAPTAKTLAYAEELISRKGKP